jgi:hypothetical protein
LNVSNRRLARTYTLQAEFDGDGVLVADPYPLYPRAFLWAHLDDGIMESVTTNWGNEGIYMQGVGPSLVGRASSGLGPLQQINLGGALQFDADGNLAYDPTDTENQIATLTTQLTTLQQQFAALNDQVELLYATLKSTAFNPYGQASLAGAGALTVALATPFSLAVPAMQANGNLQAVIGFQLPMAPRAFAAVGSLTAAALNALNIRSAMTGAGAANVALIQVPSSFKQLGSQLLSGAGGGISRLGIGLAASATLAGASNLNVGLPMALGSSASLAGASASAAKLVQTQQILQTTLAGASNISANPFVQPGASAWDPVSTLNATLSNGNKTALATGGGGARGTKGLNSGKVYFEVTINVVSRSGPMMGLCNSSYTLATGIGYDTNTVGVRAGNAYGEFFNNTTVNTSAAVPTPGDIIGFAIDFTGLAKIWAHINGTWFNGTGVTGTADFSATFSLGTMLWPVCWLDNSFGATQVTINTGPTFAFTPPSGFSAWS